VPWSVLARLPCEPAITRLRGISLGAGVVIPIGATTCGLATTANLAAYLAEQGAGQCGPCRFGLPALADRMRALVAGGRRFTAALDDLLSLLPDVEGRGACALPDGAVSLISSALQVFAEDLAAHRVRGRCLTGGGAASLPGVAR
jgi:NADH:ubiquinone oxidoreductase subunit F (NADH-binding)